MLYSYGRKITIITPPPPPSLRGRTMLNSITSHRILFSALFVFASFQLTIAQSPFIDLVPEATGGDGETISLEIKSTVRVVMRSKLGVVLRGDLLSISNVGPVIVTDRGRIRNPEGVEYKFDSIQSLNIIEHDLHWTQGEDSNSFLKAVAASESIEFENLKEFQASMEENSEPATDPDPNNDPAVNDSNSSPTTVIRMQPAKQQPIERPTVTIICGNCEKEVALSSDSGQECPHCQILWDSSPLDAAVLADLKAAEAEADAHNAANHEQHNGESTPANPQANQAVNTVAPNNNLAPQPVTVPPPIQSPPQEITLENLPLWLKFAVFGVCFGVMYYAIFVR